MVQLSEPGSVGWAGGGPGLSRAVHCWRGQGCACGDMAPVAVPADIGGDHCGGRHQVRHAVIDPHTAFTARMIVEQELN